MTETLDCICRACARVQVGCISPTSNGSDRDSRMPTSTVGPKVVRSPLNTVDVYVGARLRMRRAMLGMSQSKLGAVLGVTFQQIQKYEKGVNRISASRLKQAASVFDVEVDWFYEGGPAERGAKAGPCGRRSAAARRPVPVDDGRVQAQSRLHPDSGSESSAKDHRSRRIARAARRCRRFRDRRRRSIKRTISREPA